jgi:pSer/pThr/pTyr-binding forkhead associated (FHA) protein
MGFAGIARCEVGHQRRRQEGRAISSLNLTPRPARVSHLWGVICATCGRENPGHLVFCQECGQRLTPRVPLQVPAPGLSAPSAAPQPQRPAAPLQAPLQLQPAANPLGATVLGDSSPPSSVASLGLRPQAPSFEFARKPPSTSAPGPVRSACVRCGGWNEPGVRFCVACGSSLTIGTAGPLTVPVPAPSPSTAGPISPARVVPVTPIAARVTAEVRVCARCRGACDASSQFCRYCGAALSVASVASVVSGIEHAAPRSPPPASVTTDPIPPPLQAEPELVPAPVSTSFSPSFPASPLSFGSFALPPRALDASQASQASQAPSRSGEEHAEHTPRARLVVIAKDGGEGQSFSVGDTLDVGRSEGEVVIAEDRYLSPRHARVVRRGARLYLRDLGSTNGLYLRLRSPRGSGASVPAPRDSVAGGSFAAGGASGAGASASASAASAASAGGGSADGERGLSLAHPLRDQDLLLVGQQVLRFEVVNDSDEGLGPASQHGTLLFGSPATPRYARLCQRTVEGVTRDVFYIRKAETVLGRESGDVVFTEDPFLSRRHATVRVEKDPRRFLLTDLGSSNGTFVQVRNEIALESGDQFRIGQQLFRIDIAAVT